METSFLVGERRVHARVLTDFDEETRMGTLMLEPLAAGEADQLIGRTITTDMTSKDFTGVMVVTDITEHDRGAVAVYVPAEDVD